MIRTSKKYYVYKINNFFFVVAKIRRESNEHWEFEKDNLNEWISIQS